MNQLFLGERIVFADKNVGMCLKETGVGQMIVVKHLGQDVTVVAVKKKHTNLRAEIFHVINDFPSSGLTQKELVLGHVRLT